MPDQKDSKSAAEVLENWLTEALIRQDIADSVDLFSQTLTEPRAAAHLIERYGSLEKAEAAMRARLGLRAPPDSGRSTRILLSRVALSEAQPETMLVLSRSRRRLLRGKISFDGGESLRWAGGHISYLVVQSGSDHTDFLFSAASEVPNNVGGRLQLELWDADDRQRAVATLTETVPSAKLSVSATLEDILDWRLEAYAD